MTDFVSLLHDTVDDTGTGGTGTVSWLPERGQQYLDVGLADVTD